MSAINYINATMEGLGCIISLLVALCLLLSGRTRGSCDRLYLRMLLCNIGALLFDMLALLFRGNGGAFFRWGVRVTNFAAFTCNYLLMVTFIRYLTEYLASRACVSRWPLTAGRILCGISVVLVILTQFFPVIYTIDAQNVYHRAGLFWLSHALGLLGLALCAWLLLRYRSVMKAYEKAAAWLYVLLPVAAVIVQTFIYGPVLLNFASTIALIVVFLFLQVERERRMAEQESEYAQRRIDIVLSQIQPHFLFNALNAIHYLCETDSARAQKAVDNFSTYLWGNLESLKREAPIPFSREMEHVRSYLALEKMRFEDELVIDYDIQATGFLLPALTVQPLAENAVRYGVGKKAGGGRAAIASREYPGHYEVTVSDDGAGYDPRAAQDDGRAHIGVENVRSRLKLLCRGSLHIESRPGQGTRATITIPKEGERA